MSEERTVPVDTVYGLYLQAIQIAKTIPEFEEEALALEARLTETHDRLMEACAEARQQWDETTGPIPVDLSFVEPFRLACTATRRMMDRIAEG